MESIAIVGMGCRFPGAGDLEAFWQLLRNGVDAIAQVPSDRWNIDAFYDPNPATPRKMYTRWGGFLEQIDQFDPSFFRISPYEAKYIDPQQRLLLEVAWEALENAGIVPEKLAGSQSGVFIGAENFDYYRLLYKKLSSLDAYIGTGTSPSITANRLSYLLDLRGPSMVINTACSSSLVAVHLACQSLHNRDSNLCLVGGVNLIVFPEPTIVLSQARMMAADGRCKTFDASADGYVRGEGCGVVVLKRLSNALEDGDRILATIRGSAVNQDGLSNGITAPNGPSQQAVIRQVLENAKVQPAQISYVEAHGTGTSLGDPIEVKSLKAVLSEGRSTDQTCWIGSVKTNIGHLEPAAGISSLIKVVLSLQHREIPPHLHLKTLNPYISLAGTAFAIPTECQPWTGSTEPRLAGISAFGFGGTNSHVILEEAPLSSKVVSDVELPWHLLTLSAKTEKALQQLAGRYEDYLIGHPEASIADICFTANTGRSHFSHRLALVARSTQKLREQLSAFAAGEETVGLVSKEVRNRKRPKIAFLFTGQGSQYIGMGRQLYEQEPTFRNTLDRCDEILRPYLEQPLLSVLYPEIDDSGDNTQSKIQYPKIDETAYTQPALFALEYALFQLWKSWGVVPDAVMGHSLGEYVAAVSAGVLSLEDGLKLVAERARLMQALPTDGEMVSVLAQESHVCSVIQPYAAEVSLAAINGPQSIVISGKREKVELAIATLEAQGIKTKKLNVSHAFHSPLMEPMLAAFERVVGEVSFAPPQLNLISNVTGELATAEVANPEYWCRHVRQPVKFAASIETLHQQGYEAFVEIGPQPILLGMTYRCLPEGVGIALPSLRQGESDWQQMLQSLETLYVHGVPVDWSELHRDYPHRRLELPTYPFQRQRYWFETAENDQQQPQLEQSEIEGTRQENGNLYNGGNPRNALPPEGIRELEGDSNSPPDVETKPKQESLQPSSVQQPELLKRLRETSASDSPAKTLRERQQLLITYLQTEVAKVLGFEPTQRLDPEQGFVEMGMDSLRAVTLKRRLEADLQFSIPTTIAYESPNIQDLAQHIDKLVMGANSPDIAEAVEADLSLIDEPICASQQRFAIAIVGMGCRFPGGADNPEAFWQLLSNGVEAITEVPPERWNINAYYDPDPKATGKMYTRYGAFLTEVDKFDPQFFGISPREATSLDPQQRLLLEVSWEALENAGGVPERLSGSPTGVFVGIIGNDYARLLTQFGQLNSIDAYYANGNILSGVAGRVSYALGLTGPSMAIDTACSSSLVAVHLACQSIRNGECTQAIAGGVNLMLTPDTTVALCRAQMLSPDGRCKTFAADANGYVRGEGCGVVVLKRLSDAIADGNNILATIQGSAVNQDGPTSGFTVPSKTAQETLIRSCLDKCQIKPSEVNYVEAHGTGTSLGDPIEVRALEAVLGEGRSRENPLLVGSVKTNIGHLESAAGIASLIKVVLALQHEEIPPHLHFQQPNPYINWSELPVKVSAERTSWPRGERRRIAGVSSFGAIGTNAHVVLAEAPILPESVKADVERPLHLLTLSAKTEKAVKQLAERYENYLATNPTLPIADICFTANAGRVHFKHRLSVVTSSTTELQQQLAAFTTEGEALGLQAAQVQESTQPKVVFLFTGQGSQYIGMGRQLYETQPTFRQTLDRCDEILHPYLEKHLLEVLYPVSEETSLLNETAYTQPALFALEYALFQLWKSWGIYPDAVMGHSAGEYVAACVAGVFSLEDGLKLIAHRGRLVQSLPQDGEMVSVLASFEQAITAIQPYAGEVAIAAFNGSQSLTLSGKRGAIHQVVAALEAEGIKTKILQVSHAFHSPLMEPMLAEFEQFAKTITYSAPQLTIISNVTGQADAAEIATSEYWCRHLRQPVRFAQSIETLHQHGYDVFVECGPKPILLGMGRQCLPENVGMWLPSLRPERSDWQQLLESLSTLYIRGVKVNWSGFDRDYSRLRLPLPTYPWQEQRYWVETINPSLSATQFLPGNNTQRKHLHPLLGTRLHLAGSKEIRFECQISQDSPAYLTHHRVYGQAIFPGAAYLEIALAAGAIVFQSDQLIVEEVTIQQALKLPEGEVKTIQIVLTPEESSIYSCQIFSLQEDKDNQQPSWTLHAGGKVLMGDRLFNHNSADLSTLQAQYTESVPVETYYQQFLDLGMEYGASFQGMEKLWRQEGTALGEIRLPETLVAEADNYNLHPALIDACFQVIAGALTEKGQAHAYLPVGLERLRVYRRPTLRLWCQTQMRSAVNGSNPKNLTADLYLYAPDDGALIAVVEGLQFKQVSREVLLGTPQESRQDWLYEVEWRPQGRFGSRQLPADYLLTPSDISDRLLPELAELTSQPELKAYGELWTQIEALCAAYVLSAFQEMGWRLQLGRHFSTAQIADELHVVSQHQRLLGRLLEILSEVGILRRSGTDWEVINIPQPQDAGEQMRALLAQYSAKGELTLLDRCGSKLAEVLRGECDPLKLIFPDGDLTTITQVYQESLESKVMNTLLQKAVISALERLPQKRGVRILEIGAGTGATTSYLLPHLPEHQTEYVFTDISSLFTSKGEDKFRDYPFMRCQVLDIEQAPEAQGFTSHQFDVIVATNVLHATQDLRQTLQHVRQLLAPEGMLLLLEATAPRRWLDLTFGLTEGWWRFTDVELRPDYALIAASQWEELLRQSDFQSTVAISPAPVGAVPVAQAGRLWCLPADGAVSSQGALLQQAVIVAQAAPAKWMWSKPVGDREDKGDKGDKGDKDVSLSQPTTYDHTPAKLASPFLEPRNWLILADGQGIGQQLANQLESRGEECTLVFPGECYEQTAQYCFKVNPSNLADFEQLLKTVAMQGTPLQGVVHLWSLDTPTAEGLTSSELEAASQKVCGSTLLLIQSLVKAEFAQPPSLWLVTQGAVPAGEKSELPGVAQSPLWGMGRAIALEHPELNCKRVDLDPDAAGEEGQALFEEIWSKTAEDQVALRGNTRYVARLVQSRQGQNHEVSALASSATKEPVAFRGDSTYLITGGLGDLGLLVARWMVERGATHLVLVSRRPPDSAVSDQLKQLELAGAKAIVAQADVSSKEQIAGVLADIEQSLPPLRGVIHAAGVLEDGVLQQQTWERFAKVLAPKVQGAWHLHRLTRHLPLDFFVMFSSAASVLGSPGQANHCAANAFLDALAYARQAEGLPGLSINWALWSDIGAAAKRQVSKQMSQRGVGAIDPTSGLQILEQLLSQSSAQVGVVPINWSQWLEQMGKLPFFTDFIQLTKLSSTSQANFLEQLKAIPTVEHQDYLVVYVRSQVARVLGLNPSDINLRQGFFDLGMDSLTSMDLRNRLQTDLSCSISSTLAFDYPTTEKLVDYLSQEVLKLEIPEKSAVEPQEMNNWSEQLATLEELSQAEIALLLAEELAAIENGKAQ